VLSFSKSFAIVCCYGWVILSNHKEVICWCFHWETPQPWGLPKFVVLNSATFSIQTHPQYVHKKSLVGNLSCNMYITQAQKHGYRLKALNGQKFISNKMRENLLWTQELLDNENIALLSATVDVNWFSVQAWKYIPNLHQHLVLFAIQSIRLLLYCPSWFCPRI
jgi:hypothetical protein